MDTGYGESTMDLDSIVDDKDTTTTTWPNINKPYDELKNSKFNKNSEDFANKWLQISIKDLGYKENQTNFDSFTNDELIKYRDNLNQIHASSSKRASNKYIQQYNNDVKNQLKIVNDKIGKKTEYSPRKKRN